jgi:hypothetical protein
MVKNSEDSRLQILGQRVELWTPEYSEQETAQDDRNRSFRTDHLVSKIDRDRAVPLALEAI